MARPTKTELTQRVVLGIRAYDVHMPLFRQRVAARLGLNGTDMQCMELMFYKGLSTPSELAHHTGLTSGAATAMLDRLERSGLIERRPNPDDRRGIIITLAKSVTVKVGPLFASVRKAQDELLSSYSDQELELLADFFERFANMFDQERKKLQLSPFPPGEG